MEEKKKVIQLAAKSAKARLFDYARTSDRNFRPTPAHKFVADALQEAVDGSAGRRLILNTPPRFGKSRLSSVELPLWFLGHNPKKHAVVASYSAQLAIDRSMEARARFRGIFHRTVFPKSLPGAKNQEGNWTTSQWGSYKALGVGGSFTGRGADLLIIDDPFADYRQAHSETTRDHVWNWFLSVAMTRLSPHATIIIVATRWHVDDLAGRLMDKERVKELGEVGASENFRCINLPAIAEDNDPLGRQPGESITPDTWTAERYRAIEVAMGEYLWSAMFQGRPTLKGGNYCKVENLKIIDESEVPAGLRWARFWDLAATDKTKSDYTASLRGAYGPKPNAGEGAPRTALYLRDCIRGKWKWPLARERIRATAELEKIEVGIEAVAGFKTGTANLQEVAPSDVSIREFDEAKDKLVRALPWMAMVDNGCVYLVRGEWNKDFISELAAFPNGANDDQIDSVSGIYRMTVSEPRLLLA